jgi:hypothetical protein
MSTISGNLLRQKSSMIIFLAVAGMLLCTLDSGGSNEKYRHRRNWFAFWNICIGYLFYLQVDLVHQSPVRLKSPSSRSCP